MTRTPGVPGMPLPPREPIRVEAEQRSLSPPPASLPPAGDVQLRGNGWKITFPQVLVATALSAIGARYLPTQTATDVKIDDDRAERRARELRSEERWEETRSRLRGIEERLSRLEDARHNDRLTLESRLERLEKRQP